MKAILTKYHGPTDTRGSRISAFDGDNRIFVPYDHAASDPHDEAAIALCRKMGWAGTLVKGGTKEGNAYVWMAYNSDRTAPVVVV